MGKKRKIREDNSIRRIYTWIQDHLKEISKRSAFPLAFVTAIVLIWQNCNMSKQITLYENELQFEQKPILDHSLGEFEPSQWEDSRLIITEHVLNQGRLPAYNIIRRYSIRNSSMYPLDHFQAEADIDSIWHNILSPGIPRLDSFSIEIETEAEVESVEDLAKIMHQTEHEVYVHYWVEYEDVSERRYVLRQTFRLIGTQEGILRWSMEYAQEFEID